MRLVFALISLFVLASGASVHKRHDFINDKGTEISQDKNEAVSRPSTSAAINNKNGNLIEPRTLETSKPNSTTTTTPLPTILKPGTLNTSADEFYYLKYFFGRRFKPKKRPTYEGPVNKRLAHIRIFRRPKHAGSIHSGNSHIDRIFGRLIADNTTRDLTAAIEKNSRHAPNDIIYRKIRNDTILRRPPPKDKVPRRPTHNGTKYKRPTSNDIVRKRPIHSGTIRKRPTPNNAIHRSRNGTSNNRRTDKFYIRPKDNSKRREDNTNLRPKHIDPTKNGTTYKRPLNCNMRIPHSNSIKCNKHGRYIGLRPIGVIKLLPYS